MEEETTIQEAQTEKLEIESVVDNKNKLSDFYIELALFLILGILIGIAVKTEAVKRITVGFDDYKMKFFSQSYDLNKMQDEQIQKINAESAQAENAANADTNENQTQNTN